MWEVSGDFFRVQFKNNAFRSISAPLSIAPSSDVGETLMRGVVGKFLGCFGLDVPKPSEGGAGQRSRCLSAQTACTRTAFWSLGG